MDGRSEYKKGLWTEEEDRILLDYINRHGKGKWNHVAKSTGLNRCGKSCRLRWMNYLSPNVKRGDFSEEEDDLIIRLHNLLGNRWSLIAGRVPGRTDNQVKNHWNTHLSKKLGINKRKCKLAASSSSFSKQVARTSDTPSSSNCAPPPDFSGGDMITCQNVMEGGNKNKSQEITCTQGQTTMDWYENFWFSYDDPSLYAPHLMELLDESSLDFVWQGL